MNSNYTHICIVLDASGSMGSIQSDTQGSFNEFLKAQKESGDKTVFDLYQFSDDVTRIVEHVDLSTFTDDLMGKYRCSGCTALNDAVCIAIDTLGKELADMKETERPANIIFCIITDGMENASRKFTGEDVKKRIKEQTDKYGWNFQYLAANQDAFESGSALGIDCNNCFRFIADKLGIKNAVCNEMLGFVENVKKNKMH